MKTFDEIYNELENNNNEELNSAWIEAKEQNEENRINNNCNIRYLYCIRIIKGKIYI